MGTAVGIFVRTRAEDSFFFLFFVMCFNRFCPRLTYLSFEYLCLLLADVPFVFPRQNLHRSKNA